MLRHFKVSLIGHPDVANKDEPIYGFMQSGRGRRESVCVPLSPRHHSINREALILRDCHAKQVNYISNGTMAGRVLLGWNKAAPESERRLILSRTTVIQSRYPQTEDHRGPSKADCSRNGTKNMANRGNPFVLTLDPPF